MSRTSDTPVSPGITPVHPLRRAADADAVRAGDESLNLARTDAVKYLHSRRQAMFALARRYHLDADDLQQEAFEVLLTCLRDYNPQHTRADGSVVQVLFNTFFGTRLEGKALEMRNRDPEYQARQAHLQDLSDEEREQFRKDPPLLVQHLDQETTMQEHLRGEVSAAAGRNRTNLGLRIMQDSFVERKLNELIAAERDDKRRAALLHVKVGGVASFEEIAYHFGVTDSRASQILNDLMDAFYVQRLLDGELRSVAYDFKKLKLQDKRALRLLDEALRHAQPARATDIAEVFTPDYPSIAALLAQLNAAPAAQGLGTHAASQGNPAEQSADSTGTGFINGPDLLTAAEREQYPHIGTEWRNLDELTPLAFTFRPLGQSGQPADGLGDGTEPKAHIARLLTSEPEHWPLLITDKGLLIDGLRRLQAARATGQTRVLCHVIAVPDEYVASLLRVAVNLRAIRPDKPDLYWAIAALLERGLSQQKISVLLGTSRPNVIVYAKVREKAAPELRQLFEDGLIQITNASTAVDLPAAAQRELSGFVRTFGADWGRGPRFNELYEAAAGGTLAELTAQQRRGDPADILHEAPGALPELQPRSPYVTEAPVGREAGNSVTPSFNVVATPAPASNAAVDALRKRQLALETALRDSETWSRQREATIAQQTQNVLDLKGQVESLTRELQAAQLMSHADNGMVQSYLKELKAFLGVVERLSGAAHGVERAARQVRALTLTHRQVAEVDELVERLHTQLNGLRTELVNRRRTPSG